MKSLTQKCHQQTAGGGTTKSSVASDKLSKPLASQSKRPWGVLGAAFWMRRWKPPGQACRPSRPKMRKSHTLALWEPQCVSTLLNSRSLVRAWMLWCCAYFQHALNLQSLQGWHHITCKRQVNQCDCQTEKCFVHAILMKSWKELKWPKANIQRQRAVPKVMPQTFGYFKCCWMHCSYVYA